jgi:hypothetical protein
MSWTTTLFFSSFSYNHRKIVRLPSTTSQNLVFSFEMFFFLDYAKENPKTTISKENTRF